MPTRSALAWWVSIMDISCTQLHTIIPTSLSFPQLSSPMLLPQPTNRSQGRTSLPHMVRASRCSPFFLWVYRARWFNISCWNGCFHGASRGAAVFSGLLP